MSRFRLRRMRSVHVMIVTIVLLAPATALAVARVTSAAGQTIPKPLNLQITPRRVRFGHAVHVNGWAPASDAGSHVVVYTAPSASDSGATWRPVGQTQIAPSGRFRLRVVPRRSGLLRAVVDAAGSGPVAHIDATHTVTAAGGAPEPASASEPVAVTARFAIARRQFNVLGSGGIKVAGALLPATSGRSVALQGHTARGWRTLTHARTGSRGGFALRYRPASATGQRLRVLFAGDGNNGRTVGPAGTVTVFEPSVASWYDDAGQTACGYHAGLGVANRTLPCGTKVTFHYGGRTVHAVVDDRGPYVGGRDWDLNQNTASALGFAGVGTVWVSG